MAHQDDRFPVFTRFNVTEVYRDLDKFKERVKGLKRSIIVLRGLPGTGKTEIANTLPGKVFNIADYISEDESGNKHAYTLDNVKKAHLTLRKTIKKLLLDPKFNEPIVVSAPHSYLWELKYYKAISNQNRAPFVIYECRTLFSKENEVCAEQLKEVDINKMIGDIIKWLGTQKQKDLLPAQRDLVKYLTAPNAIKASQSQKPTNNSFCPTVFLNIQYAAWLTHRCKHNIFMDVVWHYIQEWEEITDEATIFKSNTPRWGW